MSNFIHYSESEPIISDDGRTVDFSAGSFEGDDQPFIWLYVNGFHGGGALLTMDEAQEFARKLLDTADELSGGES
ncbi:hypothetical protein [Mycolicibacter algericus]|uniref:Uncharacterized protein n=2 Tax=Mycolicibacter algericus TaxID=1288388 RepID=A0A7I9Y4F1_MYCAL|nr:hypothetical protein [Mycolicibacter algericus]OQZ96950.1 hypothetical protein BST10_10265 [Mycolicibacter algericus DSM 45454]GFG83353.1 hypothetical protein MALGJ_00290 [Mycolicibacter algericus]